MPAPRPSARGPRPTRRRRARAAGLRRGPLDGVPVSWKDLFDTARHRDRGGIGAAARPGARARRGGAGGGDAGGAGLPRQDPHDRARLLRARDQPGHRDAAEHQRPRAGARRVVLGGGGLGRLRAGGGGDRLGHRRVGAGAGGLERPGRAEDHARGCCRSRAWCRSARGSTRSGRSAARSRTRRCCWRRSAGGRRPTSTGARHRRARGSWCSTTAALGPTATSRAAAFEAALDRLAAAGARLERGRVVRGRGRGAGARGLRLRGRGLWRLGRGDRGAAGGDVPPDPRAVPLRARPSRRADYVARLAAARGAARRVARRATAAYDAVLLPTTAEPAAERGAAAGRPAITSSRRTC